MRRDEHLFDRRLVVSKWTRDGQCELAERFYLVVALPADAQGHLASVVMQDINTLQEQEMDWHELGGSRLLAHGVELACCRRP